MVDDPTRLGPEALQQLEAFRSTVGPGVDDTERALRSVLARAAERELGESDPRQSPTGVEPRRRWPWVAAAILFFGASGLAAASVVDGARLRPSTTTVHQAAVVAVAPQDPAGKALGSRLGRAAHGPDEATSRATPPARPEPGEAQEADATAPLVADDVGDDPQQPKANVKAAPSARAKAGAPVNENPSASDQPTHALPAPDPSRPLPPLADAPSPGEAPRPANEPAGVGLAEERDLLAHAQRAVARGDYDRALSYTSRHSARFADGALAPERLTIQAIALCGGGDVKAGRRVIQQLRAASPNNPGATRAERSCE